MPQNLTVEDTVELAVVERNGFVESRHVGAAVVLSAEGEIVARYGNPDALILPRSSLKPMQAIASVTAGATLTGIELALSTASHSGTDPHVQAVLGILAGAGLTENDLKCPAAWPSDPATRFDLVRENAPASPIRMNCSGKHAAMLSACLANGWDLDTYLAASHPIQQHAREVTERLAGEKVAHTAVDGCGAPAFALSITGLARAIHRIANASDHSPFALHRVAGSLVAAVKAQPWTIEGPGRPDTIAIEHLGVFAKGGAEGVMVMTAPQGATVALKILDGSPRASTAVAATLLQRVGAIEENQLVALLSAVPLDVLGGRMTVGAVRASHTL